MRREKRTAGCVCFSVFLSVLALSPAAIDGQNAVGSEGSPVDAAKLQGLTAEVERLFASPLATERAWAAYLAAKYHLKVFETEVAKLLEPELPPYSGDE